jgi:uncharacterized coiled-coil protein SlyX
VTEFLKDWWAFFAFVGTGIVGWMMGVERNRWKINDLGNAMVRLEDRVKVLETQGSDEKATLAEIKANLASVLATLNRLESRIDGKADK